MNGREWGRHSRPPMILPSQRGTAATVRTRNRQGQQEKTATYSDLVWSRHQCDQVNVHTSLPAAPNISSRASSLMVANERSEDTWTHLRLAIYDSTTHPSVFQRLFFLRCFAVVDPICVSRQFFLLAPSFNIDGTSYQGMLFCHVCPLLLSMPCTQQRWCHLCHWFPNAIPKVSEYLTPDKSAAIEDMGEGLGGFGKW